MKTLEGIALLEAVRLRFYCPHNIISLGAAFLNCQINLL